MVTRCFEEMEIGLEEGLCFMAMNKFPSKFYLWNPLVYVLVYIDCHLLNEKYFIDHLSKILGQLTCQYNKTMLIEDFNLTIDNKVSKTS